MKWSLSWIQILLCFSLYKQNNGVSPHFISTLPNKNNQHLFSQYISILSPMKNPLFFIFTLLFFLIALFFPSSHSIDEQGQALLQWKNTFNGSTQALKSWDSSSQTPCNWFGIQCNSRFQVVSITLKSIDLQGNLPWNLQPLKSLNTLILSSTNLTGQIPKAFGDYLQLTVVDVSDNSISGGIPIEICRLRNLQKLSLNTNFLEGEIPSEIGNLTSLVSLLLFDNQLDSEIPKSIGKLSKLEAFRAGGIQNLKGELPVEIGNCTNLVMLGLAETSISGSLPQSIGQLKKLETLAIYASLLSGSIPDDIGNCSSLQNIYLYQNSISGQIPNRLGELVKLQSLLMWQNSLAGTIPDGLGNCRDLTVVDLSENQLEGNIPKSLGGLLNLQELQLSVNKLIGDIPSEITSCTSLIHLEVDNNLLSGEIPIQIGNLKSLTLFFAWQNNLTGKIPESLSDCENLQALDLSFNQLYGPIPMKLFGLQNLTKMLLISNNLSGFIPPDIGNCTNLYRLRLNNNKFSGTIPPEIGRLKSLNFLDMSNNLLVGGLPATVSGCANLEFLDLHSNGLSGPFADLLPKSLQLVDFSENRLTGSLTPSIGSLTELTKLVLGKNQFSGRIPGEILSCSKLQLLDLSSNGFAGEIPKELGQIPSLEISLNLSCNQFTGKLPAEFSGLTKLGVLDLSHNMLSGNLNVLAHLQNLVTLNISFNEFSGNLPDSPFFKKLPLDDLTGNHDLYISNGVTTPADRTRHAGPSRSTMMLVTSILVSISAVLVLLAIYVLVRTRMARNGPVENNTWELTFYQKIDFSVDDIVKNLTSGNVIGTGSSGVVYRVLTPTGDSLAVKKMWSTEESGAFSSEIRTLGLIRHRNIIRLLGWGSNRNVKLLFYDYLPNGSLSSLLHGAGKRVAEWETRYEVVLGVAHALAYLHHDCMPPILHGDIKAMNVLLGSRLEPYLADFGLARVVNSSDTSDQTNQSQRPQLAGSYGYMAPEHASMQRITEKSDVYSFGVVLLEVLTGRHPLDPSLPGGANLVQWVRGHLQNKRDPVEILDPRLRGRADPQMHEMFQTLAVSFLCLSSRANDRPMMKDVAAMLKEIRQLDSAPSESEIDLKPALSDAHQSPLNRNIILQGSTSFSYAFSNESV